MTNTLPTEANDLLFEYKYRPKTIAGCVLPPALRSYFNGIVKNKKLPNLLLKSRMPGTGKTTVALALCNELDAEYTFINASVENGIDLVRYKIPNICRNVPLSGKQRVIICDEADNFSPDAQKALRGCIDEYSDTCRFILTCNYEERLSPPLKDRFSAIDFAYSKDDNLDCMKQCAKLVMGMINAEKINLTSPKVVQTLITKNSPNIRGTIVDIQQYALSNDNKIDDGILSQVTSGVSIEGVVDDIRNKNFRSLREKSSDLTKNIEIVLNELYKALMPVIIESSIPDLIESIGETNRALPNVIIKEIEVHYLFARLVVKLKFK